MLRRWIERLGGSRPADPAGPTVSRAVGVVGDVHGCHDALTALLARMRPALAGAAGDARPALVFLGDYVDRGPRSDAVLADLRGMQDVSGDVEVVCLMGNHERMMLDAMDDPARHGRLWLRNGGLETVASFGIAPPPPLMRPEDLPATLHALRDALPPGLEHWLRSLPRWWRDGTLVCVHAGLDPTRPPEAQEEETMLWSRPSPGAGARRDGLWVAHGHTIVPEPLAADGRIAVDTGAYDGGPLTGAVITSGAVAFVQSR